MTVTTSATSQSPSRRTCAVLVGLVVYVARVLPVGLAATPPSIALAQGSRADDELAEARRLNQEATAIRSSGKFSEAVPLVQRALAIQEKILGPEHPDVTASLDNLAGLYRDQGKYAEAEPLYRRALAIGEKALGPEHPAVAESLNNLAELYDAQGKVRAGRAAVSARARHPGKGAGAGAPRCGHGPRQLGRALQGAGQVCGGRAAVSARARHPGEGAGAGAPERGHRAGALGRGSAEDEQNGRGRRNGGSREDDQSQARPDCPGEVTPRAGYVEAGAALFAASADRYHAASGPAAVWFGRL